MPNILIVDDVGLIRLKLARILKSEGFKVFESTDIKSVKNNLFSNKKTLQDIDIVLLDIYLKGENGLDLLEYLKNNYPNIKVIMISVESKKEVIKNAIYLGAKDYIIKPFDKETLINKIYTLLNRESIKEIESDAHTERFQNNRNKLQTNLSLEITRSIRSKLPFSLIKMDFSEDISEDNVKNIKEKITGTIRNIDQIYFIDNYKYIFILPLTDKEGSEIFVEKILEEVEKESKVEIKIKVSTFPETVLEDDEKLNYRRQNKYKEKLLKKLISK